MRFPPPRLDLHKPLANALIGHLPTHRQGALCKKLQLMGFRKAAKLRGKPDPAVSTGIKLVRLLGKQWNSSCVEWLLWTRGFAHPPPILTKICKVGTAISAWEPRNVNPSGASHYPAVPRPVNCRAGIHTWVCDGKNHVPSTPPAPPPLAWRKETAIVRSDEGRACKEVFLRTGGGGELSCALPQPALGSGPRPPPYTSSWTQNFTADRGPCSIFTNIFSPLLYQRKAHEQVLRRPPTCYVTWVNKSGL